MGRKDEVVGQPCAHLPMARTWSPAHAQGAGHAGSLAAWGPSVCPYRGPCTGLGLGCLDLAGRRHACPGPHTFSPGGRAGLGAWNAGCAAVAAGTACSGLKRRPPTPPPPPPPQALAGSHMLWKAGRWPPLWEHREAGAQSSLSVLPRGHVHLVGLLFS